MHPRSPKSRFTAGAQRRLLLALGCTALVACPGPQPDCRVGADCASGVCNRDGTCAAASSGDGGSDAGLETGRDAGEDGGLGRADAGSVVTGDAGLPPGCQLQGDGRIERSEVLLRDGLRATFKVSGAAAFDTAGASAADGGRQWDFRPMLAGDGARLVETRALVGAWYAAEFPDGGYVAELGQGGELLGVFSASPDALYLQGVVSPANGAGATELHYEPWVKVLQFPLQAGASWATTADVSGRYQGLTIGAAAFGTGYPFMQDTYTSSVDRAGLARTPYFDFDALRVRTVLERATRVYTLNPWVQILTKRTFSWNAECFGTVATVTSKDDEASTEFNEVVEVRRLSP